MNIIVGHRNRTVDIDGQKTVVPDDIGLFLCLFF